MKALLNKLPHNTVLAALIDEDMYDSCLRDTWLGYSAKPPFLISIYFFPSETYLIDYDDKVLGDRFKLNNNSLSIEFKYFIRNLLRQNRTLLNLLFFDKSVYFYKDFYGRALIDNRDLFTQESFDVDRIKKMFKEIMYDYLFSNYKK